MNLFQKRFRVDDESLIVGEVEAGGLWSAGWPGDAATQFFVQVVDEAGNVSVVDKDGLCFQPGDGVMRWVVYLPLVVRGN